MNCENGSAVYGAPTKWQLAAPQNFNHWEAHPRRLPCTDPENTVNSYSFLLTRYVQVNIAQWGASRISDEMAAALAIRAAPRVSLNWHRAAERLRIFRPI